MKGPWNCYFSSSGLMYNEQYICRYRGSIGSYRCEKCRDWKQRFDDGLLCIYDDVAEREVEIL